jgi:hypothetical protein
MSDSIYELISRAEAKEKGLTHYFTGNPCKHGHISKRLVCNGTCEKCICIASNEYKNKNKQKVVDENRAWRHKNKEKNEEYNIKYRKNYYKNNREIIKENVRNWRLLNPDKHSKQSRLRNTRLERQIPGWYEEDLVKQIYIKRDELNKLWGTNLQVDHIIPLVSYTVCGLHCWHNLQLLDKPLNGSKNNKYQTDW